MTEDEKAAAAKAEEEKKTAEAAEAKKKADEEAKAKAPKKVRVICEGTLGSKLLEKGAETADAEYVSLLGTKRGKKLVEAV